MAAFRSASFVRSTLSNALPGLMHIRNSQQLISVDEIEESIIHFGKDFAKGAAKTLPHSDDLLATIAPDLMLTNYTGPRFDMAQFEIGVRFCPFIICVLIRRRESLGLAATQQWFKALLAIARWPSSRFVYRLSQVKAPSLRLWRTSGMLRRL